MKKTLLVFILFCSYVLFGQDSAPENSNNEDGLIVSGGINYAGIATTNGNLYILNLQDLEIKNQKIKKGTVISFSVRSTNIAAAAILITNGKTSTKPFPIFKEKNRQLEKGILDAGRLIMVLFHENEFYLIDGKDDLAKYLTLCDNTWTNLDTDADFCGACAISCANGERCVDGACVKKCPGGKSPCNDICTATNTDPKNCGGCNILCAPGEVCHNGECLSSCPDNKTLCNGQCIDLKSDPNHCTTCGIFCMPGFICHNGRCIIECPEDLQKCSNTCSDLKTDNNNCGACGLQCPDGYKCVNGICTIQCKKGEKSCDGICADIFNDPNHCGDCNRKCPPGQNCKNGKCQ